MKEIEVKEKRYQCEHCGTKHKKAGAIQSCVVCGKELCSSCTEKVKLYRNDWEDWYETYAHKECLGRVYKGGWEHEYFNAMISLEKEYFDKIDELNKKYLSSDDEDYFRKFVWL